MPPTARWPLSCTIPRASAPFRNSPSGFESARVKGMFVRERSDKAALFLQPLEHEAGDVPGAGRGVLVGPPAQSSGSTFTSRWSWLLPTQNVVGVVDLSTNTVRMLVSDGMRYCTALPVLGSRRTTRSVCMVETQSSPLRSKSARYGYVRAGSSYSVNFSALVSNNATLLPRYSVTTMRS